MNKKSWHTGGSKQREAVWKREQEHAREEAKLKELQKQIAEEKEQDALKQLAENNRHQKKTQERLEFMYNTPLASVEAGGAGAAGGASASALEEEERKKFLLGEKKADLSGVKETQVSQCDRVAGASGAGGAFLPSAYSENTAQSRNEVWSRMQNDPLLAIKRQQQNALKKIRSNPVHMQSIRQEVRAARAAGEGGERERGEDGSTRRHRRKHRRSHHRSEGDHGDHGDRDAGAGAEGDRERGRERDGGRKHRHHHRSSSGRERSSRRERRERRERSRSPVASAAPAAAMAARGPAPVASTRDGGCAQGPDAKYGLVSSEQGQAGGTSQHAEGKFNARDRIRAAAEAQERERREAERKNGAWSYGGKRQKHRTGRLSEDEKQRRLAEMMSAAATHESSRAGEIERKEAEERARDEAARAPAGGDTFLDTFQKNVYGANPNEGLSLEDAIGRRKFYSQRK